MSKVVRSKIFNQKRIALVGNFLIIKKDHREFYKFMKEQHIWHKRLYSLDKRGVMNIPHIFPEHILDEPLKESEQEHQEHHPTRKS